ncbi:MAG: porin family protein [Flavitalea sp.]
MTQTLRASKRTMAIALVFSLMAFDSYSQTTRFNLLANAVTTNFNYGKSNRALQSYKKNVAGVQLGASFQAGITPVFSIVAETYFMMKGGTLKTGNSFTVHQSTLRLYTAEMPVLARFQLGRLYLNSGPYVAYTFAGHVKTGGSQAIPEKSTNVSFANTANGFKRWEMGAQAGAGYVFRIKKFPLALDARYVYGLTNISREEERYNRALNISLLLFKPWKKNPFGTKEHS